MYQISYMYFEIVLQVPVVGILQVNLLIFDLVYQVSMRVMVRLLNDL